MKKKVVITAITGTLLLGLAGGATQAGYAYAKGYGYRHGNSTTNDTIIHTETNEDVILVTQEGDYGAKAAEKDADLTLEDMLIYAMQDEYLAKATYEDVMNTYGTGRPFSNITNAEQRHISALTTLFNRYGIAIPEDEAAQYIAQPATLNDAYKLGVQSEIDNIAMYERFLQEDNLPRDVRTVFTSLRDASQNHLNAFQKHVY